ncbi:winged helix-turn-helix transcriptional regulator [Rhodococcus sp. NPDC057014]|uniref:winged helix-turn-helix transcriptional regulator n=1 Tax=Rhodococcus sp. NPDC057014 TaxID=3346000 RepID=UPI003625C0AE
MRRTHFTEMNCSVAQTLEIVGEWWTLLIVRDALFGVTRFDDFQNRLGIARNILTLRLETLVDHGVMVKDQYQDKPIRYDYRLTKRGKDLWMVIAAMRQWGDIWLADGGPPLEFVHRTCGCSMTIQPVCSACAHVVDRESLSSIPGPGASREDLPPGPSR